MEGKGKYFEGVGRRKSSVARVRFYPEGPGGKFVVNEKDHDKYFNLARHVQSSTAALVVLDGTTKKGAAVTVQVKGGGPTGQAEAITLGLSRALVKFNEDFREQLRVLGFLTRDSRRVERKKPGLKKARRAPQWRKR